MGHTRRCVRTRPPSTAEPFRCGHARQNTIQDNFFSDYTSIPADSSSKVSKMADASAFPLGWRSCVGALLGHTDTNNVRRLTHMCVSPMLCGVEPLLDLLKTPFKLTGRETNCFVLVLQNPFLTLDDVVNLTNKRRWDVWDDIIKTRDEIRKVFRVIHLALASECFHALTYDSPETAKKWQDLHLFLQRQSTTPLPPPQSIEGMRPTDAEEEAAFSRTQYLLKILTWEQEIKWRTTIFHRKLWEEDVFTPKFEEQGRAEWKEIEQMSIQRSARCLDDSRFFFGKIVDGAALIRVGGSMGRIHSLHVKAPSTYAHGFQRCVCWGNRLCNPGA